MAEERYEDGVITGWAAQATYDELGLATALSRSLISQGLQRLQVLGLIRPEGSHQKRCYWIIWGGTGWFKLPCQAIVAGPVIVPFKNFTLRSKPELHAMKLYLYLAAVRDNGTPYSMASYETIYAKTGILERDIRKAISVLIGCGLIASVDRKHEEGLNEYGPNKYYLKGHHKLVGST
jgi:predicted transcriptional regulator